MYDDDLDNGFLNGFSGKYNGSYYSNGTQLVADPNAGGFSWGDFFKTDNKGNSTFGATAGGLASLYSIYGGLQGQKLAKEQLGLQKQQYADAKKYQQAADDRKAAWGKGLAAAVATPKVV